MQENDYILLLHKKFTGVIAADELQALETWISQSSRNAALAQQYAQIWADANLPEKQFTLDLDAEFTSLQRRIAQAEPLRAKTVSLGYRWMRVAAGLTLLLAALWGYLRFAGAPAVEMIVVQSGTLEKKQIDLPDGTQVWLRKNSRLEYPVALGATELRRVKLSGEAYFDVAHQAGKPFRVEMPGNSRVEVLGTEFDVKAHPGDSESMVLVRVGKVRFSPNGMENGPILTAGEKAVFNRDLAEVRRSKVSSFNELAWQFGGFRFVGTPLRKVVSDLESYYGVDIEVRNPALLNCNYTAPLTDQPVEQVLKSISTAYQAEVTNPEPGRFLLSGGNGCPQK